jgi:hypothetical protein
VDLGKPENVQSPNAYFPLSGFHRSKVALPAGRRAELLFLGTQLPVDGGSALMRWPVIKALQQFGTLSNVQPVRPSCTPAQIVPENGCPFFPTFDWSHASYSSKYVTFVHKDLLNKVGARYQRMAPIEEKLYRAYARSSNRLPNDPDRVRASASFFGATATTRHLPLIAVDRYVETQSQVIVVGDFQLTVPITPATPTGFSERTQNYTWDQLHQALVTGKDPGTGSHTVEDVNAEANIITALICKADGGKPGSVCGRPAIGAILRHIR